jgi:hypothetical protein
MTRFFKLVNLERGLMIGAGGLLAGLVLLLASFNQWRMNDFGQLGIFVGLLVAAIRLSLSFQGGGRECRILISAGHKWRPMNIGHINSENAVEPLKSGCCSSLEQLTSEEQIAEQVTIREDSQII